MKIWKEHNHIWSHCTQLMTSSNISHVPCVEDVWFAELVDWFYPFLEFSANVLLWFINITSGCGVAFLFHTVFSGSSRPLRGFQFPCLPTAEPTVLCISHEHTVYICFWEKYSFIFKLYSTTKRNTIYRISSNPYLIKQNQTISYSMQQVWWGCITFW